VGSYRLVMGFDVEAASDLEAYLAACGVGQASGGDFRFELLRLGNPPGQNRVVWDDLTLRENAHRRLGVPLHGTLGTMHLSR